MQQALLVTVALLAVATVSGSKAGPSFQDIQAACYGSNGPREDCTLLIAQSIVANSKSCLAQSRSDAGAGNGLQSDYESCVKNFCSQQCSSHSECSDYCVEKGKGLFDKLAPSAPTLIQLSAGVTSTATAAAKAWLNALDAPPQDDELAELKDANPEAYGIVKALLVKQQLGLLDPRHPTASMRANAVPAVSAEDKAALNRMEAEVAAKKDPTEAESTPDSTALYPEAAAAPAHRDWLNWKPQDSAASDDQMVQNVLGTVAQLKGGASTVQGSLLTRRSDTAGNSLAAQAAALGFDASQDESSPPAAPAVDSTPSAVAAPAADRVPPSVSQPAVDSAQPVFAAPAADSMPTMADSMAAAAPANPPAKKTGSFWGSLFSGLAAKQQVAQQASPATPEAAAAPQNPYLQAVDWQADRTTPSQGGANAYLTSSGLGSAPAEGSFLTQKKQVQQSVSPYLEAVAELR